jgi:hypothetical protein
MELGEGVRHRTNRYLNNHLEQDHRVIKQRIRPMGDFKSDERTANGQHMASYRLHPVLRELRSRGRDRGAQNHTRARRPRKRALARVSLSEAVAAPVVRRSADRLTTPLRRRPDGTHEPISWDTAFAEIAARLKAIHAEHGGEAFAFWGGGGVWIFLPIDR